MLAIPDSIITTNRHQKAPWHVEKLQDKTKLPEQATAETFFNLVTPTAVPCLVSSLLKKCLCGVCAKCKFNVPTTNTPQHTPTRRINKLDRPGVVAVIHISHRILIAGTIKALFVSTRGVTKDNVENMVCIHTYRQYTRID